MIEINELINHPIQLEGVDMISCNLNKEMELYDSQNSDIEVKLKSWGKINKYDNNIGYSFLNIKIDFSGEIKPFYIDVTYRGKCILDKKIEGDARFENFLETQGLKLLWPYIRVAITDIMIKMDIEPIKLPTLDVLKTMEKASTRDVRDK